MKKQFFWLLFTIILSSSIAWATPKFKEPIIQKSYLEALSRLDAKTSKTVLDENVKNLLTKKKESIAKALIAADVAWQKKNKKEFAAQVGLFRMEYNDAMKFLAGQPLANNPPVQTESSESEDGRETVGVPADITYYADNFEWGRTANGDIFSQTIFSAAQCGMPLNTLVQVFSDNRSVIVKTNDRPNCTKYPNLVDLSKTAFGSIGKVSKGKIPGSTISLGSVSKGYVKTYLDTDTFQDLGIELTPGIPNTYLKNETIHIRGKELFLKDFVLLYLVSPSWKEISFAMKKSEDGSFDQSYSLEETGNYHMVVASGLGFSTNKFVDLVVLDESLFKEKKLVEGPDETPLVSLTTERVESSDHQWLYIIRFPKNDFYTISFSDGQNTRTYRGFGSVTLNHDTLSVFTPDIPVNVEVSVQKSSTVFSHDTYTLPKSIFKKTMSLTSWFTTEKNEDISIRESKGKAIISGKIRTGRNVKKEMVLILPNGSTESYPFNPRFLDSDGFLKRETSFEQAVTLKWSGLYLVEVNYDNGFAAYNGPIVQGENILALYKNDYDGQENSVAKDSSKVDAESLSFVNKIREKAGKLALSLDINLWKLGTIKARDMADHDYISHTDSYGEKIDATAKRNKIAVANIGENIAGGNVHYNILMLGLSHSWGHRENMLEDWSKLGIGYAVKNGKAYYVQVFSN